MPDLEDLKTFVEVAETGGLTPAAQRLGVSKSIVSRRLANLEAELGAQLVARTTRGVSLTEAGSIFHQHASRIAAEYECGREAVTQGEEVRGLLRIAAPLSFGATHLGPVLAELALRHPKLEVHTVYSDRFVDLIADRYDVAIRIGILPDSSLVARRIAPIRARTVASPAYIKAHGAPKTPDELVERHEAIMQGHEAWRVLSKGKVVTFRPQGRFKADSGQALVAAVVAGLGVGMMPDFLCEPYVETGELVTIMTEYPVPDAGLFVVRPPPAEHLPRKVEALTNLLIERFGGI